MMKKGYKKGNKIEIIDDHAVIHIDSKKYGHFEVLIDLEDVEKVKRHTCCVHLRRRTFYCLTKISIGNGKWRTLSMHRLIMNPGPKEHIDHINHDTLNNRKSNLRIVTNQQNHYNRKPNSNSSSKYKGVTWVKRNKKWQSQIKKDGKLYHLGLFTSEEEAAKAYDSKALELFGEFTYLNFPQGEQ